MVTQQPGRSGQHGTSFLEVKESRFWDNIVSLLILQPKQVMTINTAQSKLGCVYSMVIWSELRMGHYSDDDHRIRATHFIQQSHLAVSILRWSNPG